MEVELSEFGIPDSSVVFTLGIGGVAGCAVLGAARSDDHIGVGEGRRDGEDVVPVGVRDDEVRDQRGWNGGGECIFFKGGEGWHEIEVFVQGLY